jgi:hypothetical protein
METYIIIISALFSSIAIAYRISSKIKSSNIIPFVIVDGISGISFPVGVPNDSSIEGNIDTNKSIKGYFKIKQINNIDINNFTTISNNIEWKHILESILNKKELTEKSYLSEIKLFNVVIIECQVESSPPIMAEIQFHTDNTIKIKWK